MITTLARSWYGNTATAMAHNSAELQSESGRKFWLKATADSQLQAAERLEVMIKAVDRKKAGERKEAKEHRSHTTQRPHPKFPRAPTPPIPRQMSESPYTYGPSSREQSPMIKLRNCFSAAPPPMTAPSLGTFNSLPAGVPTYQLLGTMPSAAPQPIYWNGPAPTPNYEFRAPLESLEVLEEERGRSRRRRDQ